MTGSTEVASTVAQDEPVPPAPDVSALADTEAHALPPAAAAEAPPEMVALTETAVAVAASSGAEPGGEADAVSAAVATRTVVAGGRETALQLSEDGGLAVTAYERAAELASRRDLLKLLVPEERLVALWAEIDRTEAEVAGLRRGSRKIVDELIDRLTAARNMLLHDRDQFENAQREVSLVRQRLIRLQNSMFSEQPYFIMIYLFGLLGLIAAGFLLAPRFGTVLGNPTEIAGLEPRTLWYTVLWGGIGGLSAAFYALKRHVEDYDPLHAKWYYLSPPLGLFFGPLIALLADIGLPALMFMAVTDMGVVEVRPALLYLLAWIVGFQQNLLLRLINTVLLRLFPEGKPESTPERPLPQPAAPQG